MYVSVCVSVCVCVSVYIDYLKKFLTDFDETWQGGVYNAVTAFRSEITVLGFRSPSFLFIYSRDYVP